MKAIKLIFIVWKKTVLVNGNLGKLGFRKLSIISNWEFLILNASKIVEEKAKEVFGEFYRIKLHNSIDSNLDIKMAVLWWIMSSIQSYLSVSSIRRINFEFKGSNPEKKVSSK